MLQPPSSTAALAGEHQRPRYRALLALVLTLAIAPRLVLALYNSEANDNHMEVVALMADNGVSPLVDDCWQCCQAKLFHGSVALTVSTLGVTDAHTRTVIAQLFNAIAGTLTVVLLWILSGRLSLPIQVRMTAFALAVLNPKFIGINAQATNDSFVILFATAAIAAFLAFLDSRERGWLAATLAALILASISKTQGIVLFAMMITILIARGLVAISRDQRRLHLLSAALIVVVYLSTVPFLGPYWAHYVTKGTPFAWNTPKVEAPAFVKKSEVRRPGIRSVVDGYATFRIVDLLHEPVIRGRGYAEHRTSLWSQVYARSQFSRFDGWPPSWRSKDPRVLNLGRAALLLGLIPLLILLRGMIVDVADLARGMHNRGARYLADTNRWVITAMAGGMLFLVAKFSYDLRDFSAMKAIYIYPGMGCFMLVFARSMRDVVNAMAERYRPLLYVCLALLIAVYSADVWILAADLARVAKGT